MYSLRLKDALCVRGARSGLLWLAEGTETEARGEE